jgi:hypothetical protein
MEMHSINECYYSISEFDLLCADLFPLGAGVFASLLRLTSYVSHFP